MRVGVLALQGDFAEHVAALRRVGPVHSEPVEVREVRTARELEEVDGLVIPGGESTTIGKLLRDFGILEPLRRRVACGLPVLGTCAGAIVLARVPRLVFGAADPKAGACGSVLDVLRERRLNHRVDVMPAVQAQECGALLSAFFEQMRKG